MSSSDSTEMTVWPGGSNPAPGLFVDVVFRDGDASLKARNSSHLDWLHYGRDSDIVKFRAAGAKEAHQDAPASSSAASFSAYEALQAGAVEFPPIDASMIADRVTIDGVQLGSGAVRIGGAAVGFGVAPASAPGLLQAAATHMAARAATYDKPDGERSMAQTVAVFKAFHGIELSESQGWHFMQILKDVRLFTRPAYHADSAEDCIAFAALKAEARAKEGGDKSSSKS